MRITLVIEDEKGKNILFITNSGLALTSNETLSAVENETIDNYHIVSPDLKLTFVRSNPNNADDDNLDTSALSFIQFKEGLENYDRVINLPALQEYEKIRQENIMRAVDCIFVDGTPRKRKSEVITHINKYKPLIIEAANKQNIDPNTLAAILIDEYLRMGPNDWFDWRAKIGITTTIGIAQVNVETARNLIKQGLYNPNPKDQKLNPENIDKTFKAHLYKYLKDPLHSANLSAAKIRYDINRWAPESDISNRPDILGTVYSLEEKPIHDNPDSNDRGKQIANEFYPLAKKALSER